MPLDLFCLHRRSSSYFRGIRVLQLCPVIERSLNKADDCRCSKMAAKKIKLQEEAISEILVPDTNLESGAEAINVEDEFEEEEEKEQQQKKKHRLQPVADCQPGDCLKEGTQIFILVSVQQKSVKNSEAAYIK